MQQLYLPVKQKTACVNSVELFVLLEGMFGICSALQLQLQNLFAAL